MPGPIRSLPSQEDTELLSPVLAYLLDRKQGSSPAKELEAVWTRFYELYAGKIRAYAFRCGATEEELADCTQEVWRELLVRLPTFQLDLSRGQFDTWLFSIVQSKTADLHRAQKRRLLQGSAEGLERVPDYRSSLCGNREDREVIGQAWDQLQKRLSPCSFQALRLRLIEQWPVARVAEALGLSHDQVRYRCYRARRQLQQIGSALACGRCEIRGTGDTSDEDFKNPQDSAPQMPLRSVSVSVSGGCRAPGGTMV